MLTFHPLSKPSMASQQGALFLSLVFSISYDVLLWPRIHSVGSLCVFVSWYRNTFTGANSCSLSMVIPSLGQTAVPLLLQYLHWDKQQHQKSLAAAITGLKMSSWENLSPGVFSHNRPAFVATTKGTKLFPTSMASTVLYWHTKPDGNQSLQQCFTGTQNQTGKTPFL